MPDALATTRKARPILFSGPMVRAIYREIERPGTGKTQTRRTSGLDFVNDAPDRWEFRRFFTDAQGRYAAEFHGIGGKMVTIPCPYGGPGDLLWIKETWKPHFIYAHLRPRDVPASELFYRADEAYAPSNTPWVPSIFMLRWMSRFTGISQDIRAHRVQEIGDCDAIAEGLITQEGDGLGPGPGFKWHGTGYHGGAVSKLWGRCYHTPHSDGRPGCSCNVAGPSPAQCAYRELWDSINAKRGYGWDANPWAWAVTFRPILANVDEVSS